MKDTKSEVPLTKFPRRKLVHKPGKVEVSTVVGDIEYGSATFCR